MNDILYMLRYAIPSVVVFLTAYYLLKAFFQQENRRKQFDLAAERMRISLPLRLQAYERLILLLERISPNNLIMRVYRPEWSAKELQQQLVQSIRDEYTHNLSQQLYVSQETWDMINRAYEEMIGQINSLASSLDEKANAIDLSQKLLETDLERSATNKAMYYLKSEARKVFGTK
ncbi:MAG: hypothetical protein R6U62_07665 [Bacteroidales bacterium]